MSDTEPKHEGSPKHSARDDFAVFVCMEAIGGPFTHDSVAALMAGHHWEAFFTGLLGVPMMIIGASYHWLRPRIGTNWAVWIRRSAARWAAPAFLIGSAYFLLTGVYRNQEPSASAVASVVSSPAQTTTQPSAGENSTHSEQIEAISKSKPPTMSDWERRAQRSNRPLQEKLSDLPKPKDIASVSDLSNDQLRIESLALANIISEFYEIYWDEIASIHHNDVLTPEDKATNLVKLEKQASDLYRVNYMPYYKVLMTELRNRVKGNIYAPNFEQDTIPLDQIEFSSGTLESTAEKLP